MAFDANAVNNAGGDCDSGMAVHWQQSLHGKGLSCKKNNGGSAPPFDNDDEVGFCLREYSYHIWNALAGVILPCIRLRLARIGGKDKGEGLDWIV